MAAKIKDGLFIGDAETSQSEVFINDNKISNLINLAGREVHNVWAAHGLVYLTHYWEDRPDFKLFSGHDDPMLTDIVEFIDVSINHGISVLLFSNNGTGRCVIAACVYLMLKYRWGFEKTYDYVYSKKPDIDLNKGFIQQMFALDMKLLAARQKQYAELHGLDNTFKIEANMTISDISAMLSPNEALRWNAWEPSYVLDVSKRLNPVYYPHLQSTSSTSSTSSTPKAGSKLTRSDSKLGEKASSPRNKRKEAEIVAEMAIGNPDDHEEELVLIYSFINSKNTITSLPGPYRHVYEIPKDFTLRFDHVCFEEDVNMFPTLPPTDEQAAVPPKSVLKHQDGIPGGGIRYSKHSCVNNGTGKTLETTAQPKNLHEQPPSLGYSTVNDNNTNSDTKKWKSLGETQKEHKKQTADQPVEPQLAEQQSASAGNPDVSAESKSAPVLESIAPMYVINSTRYAAPSSQQTTRSGSSNLGASYYSHAIDEDSQHQQHNNNKKGARPQQQQNQTKYSQSQGVVQEHVAAVTGGHHPHAPSSTRDSTEDLLSVASANSGVSGLSGTHAQSQRSSDLYEFVGLQDNSNHNTITGSNNSGTNASNRRSPSPQPPQRPPSPVGRNDNNNISSSSSNRSAPPSVRDRYTSNLSRRNGDAKDSSSELDSNRRTYSSSGSSNGSANNNTHSKTASRSNSLSAEERLRNLMADMQTQKQHTSSGNSSNYSSNQSSSSGPSLYELATMGHPSNNGATIPGYNFTSSSSNSGNVNTNQSYNNSNNLNRSFRPKSGSPQQDGGDIDNPLAAFGIGRQRQSLQRIGSDGQMSGGDANSSSFSALSQSGGMSSRSSRGGAVRARHDVVTGSVNGRQSFDSTAPQTRSAWGANSAGPNNNTPSRYASPGVRRTSSNLSVGSTNSRGGAASVASTVSGDGNNSYYSHRSSSGAVGSGSASGKRVYRHGSPAPNNSRSNNATARINGTSGSSARDRYGTGNTSSGIAPRRVSTGSSNSSSNSRHASPAQQRRSGSPSLALGSSGSRSSSPAHGLSSTDNANGNSSSRRQPSPARSGGLSSSSSGGAAFGVSSRRFTTSTPQSNQHHDYDGTHNNDNRSSTGNDVGSGSSYLHRNPSPRSSTPTRGAWK